MVQLFTRSFRRNRCTCFCKRWTMITSRSLGRAHHCVYSAVAIFPYPRSTRFRFRSRSSHGTLSAWVTLQSELHRAAKPPAPGPAVRRCQGHAAQAALYGRRNGGRRPWGWRGWVLGLRPP